MYGMGFVRVMVWGTLGEWDSQNLGVIEGFFLFGGWFYGLDGFRVWGFVFFVLGARSMF